MTSSSVTITHLLSELGNGNADAASELMPRIYAELHRIAAHHFQHERSGHTLQPTALVHETYVRLGKRLRGPWKNRTHFFGVASNAMRQILVEYARARAAKKRGGRLQRVTLDEATAVFEAQSTNLLALDEALTKLRQFDPRQSRIVELRYFGGLSIRETAQALRISVSTVKVEWDFARAWLRRELKKTE
jgi:RNA polymerase sigma-70 factor (ECF subfamily)